MPINNDLDEQTALRVLPPAKSSMSRQRLADNLINDFGFGSELEPKAEDTMQELTANEEHATTTFGVDDETKTESLKLRMKGVFGGLQTAGVNKNRQHEKTFTC